MLKVAIYCRLSVEDKNKTIDESESIQNQKSLLLNYCMEREWNIYKIYCDEDYSGADNDRPEFNLMLNDAQQKKFGVILCKTQSRFSRDMEIVEKYIHNKFLEWNIRFVSVVDNADTEIKGNKKARQINGLINEWFLEDLSDNIKMVLNNKRKTGKYIGSYEPFGYEKDKKDKNKLIIDKNAADIVHRIFNMYISGMGSTSIALSLNNEQIPNPSQYKKEKGVPYSPPKSSNTYNKWSDTTIRSILTNEMYIGNMVQGKFSRISYKNQKLVRVPKNQWMIVEDTHPPIIAQSIFQQVQDRLGKYSKPCKDGVINPLAYKIKCMYCGGHFHKHKAKGYEYVRCRTNITDHELCIGQSIRLDKLMDMVLFEINNYISAYKKDDLIDRDLEINNEREINLIKLEKEKQEIENKLNEKSMMLKSLYIDKLKNVISEEQFLEFNSIFAEEKNILEKQAKSIIKKIESFDKINTENNFKIELFKKFGKINVLNKEITDEFIKCVEIGIGKNKKEKLIKIYWQF